MVVVRSLKDIISIKIKARHDSPCDQFNRLFMTKMFLIAAIIMGFDYFSDRIACIHPQSSELSKEFVHSACWISGFYIYDEMRENLLESGYYGIPYRIQYNGIDVDGQLCNTHDRIQRRPCTEMTRVYYLQYQWMPFYIGALGVLYYLPYILFCVVNEDLISLKNVLLSARCDADHIVRNYFNYKVNSIGKLRIQVVINIFIKCLYIVVTLSGFCFTNYLLHGNYETYGTDYLNWAQTENEKQRHLPVAKRQIAKPGNALLPSMGYCEVEEASKDQLQTLHNSYRFLCEVSTNILYQYVLLVLWFLFIVSIAISILGLVSPICVHLFHLLRFDRISSPKKTIYRAITLREIEYLQFIKKKNMVVYGEVLRKLKQQRSDLHGKIVNGFETSNGYV